MMRHRAAALRTLWLLAAAAVVGLALAATPLRYRMLQADVYGFGPGLRALGVSLTFFALYFTAWELLFVGGALLVAVLIAWKRADDWFAMLVAASLTLLGLLPPLVDGLGYANPAWLAPVSALRLLAMGCGLAVFCLFPNGRFSPAWTRPLLGLWLLLLLGAGLADPLLLADTAVLPNTRTLDDALWLLIGVGWFGAAMGGQLVRYRRHATTAERLQMKWVLAGLATMLLFGLVTTLLLLILPGLSSVPAARARFTLVAGAAYLLTGLALPATIAFSILRYRLWQVDVLLNRTLMYGGLTALITAVYALLVGVAGSLAVTERSALAALLVATALVLGGIRPAHRWLQARVDRWLPRPPPAPPAPAQGPGALRLAWGLHALLALALLAAGLVVQSRHGFWQLPSPPALAGLPFLVPMLTENPLLGGGRLYPVVLLAAYTQAATFVAVGLLLFRRKSSHVMGVLSSWMLLAVGIGFTPTVMFLPLLAPAWHVPTSLFQAGLFGTVFLFLCLFPDGRFTPRWTRAAAAAWLGYTLLWIPFPGLNPHRAGTAGAALMLLAAVWVGVAAQVDRYRRTSGLVARQQARWVIAGFVVANLGLSGVWLLLESGQVTSAPLVATAILVLGLASMAIPVTIGIALLRYRLWQVDLLLNRTLVVGGLTALITAVYLLFVVGAGALVRSQSGRAVGLLLATALVLAGVRPARRRLQAAADRLFPAPAPAVAATRRDPETGGAAGQPLHGPRAGLAWLSLLLAVLIAAGLVGLDVARGDGPASLWLFHLIIPAYVGVGTLIVIHHPANRIGRLCLAIGWLYVPAQAVPLLVDTGLAAALLAPPAVSLLVHLNLSLMKLMAMLMLVYLPLLFPDGQFLSPRWRRFGQGFGLLMILPILLAFIRPGPMLDWARGVYTFDNPLGVGWPWLGNLSSITLFLAWSVPTMLAVFTAVGSLVLRWRRDQSEARQQTKWVVYFLGLVVAPFILGELVGELFYPALFETGVYAIFGAVAFVGLPLVIGLAIFKYRLYDIDILINRTLVYGGLSLGIVAVYVVVVGALGALFQAQGDFLFALLATGLIAVLFQPVRARLQRGVNRLMFGERDDPYVVLSRLGAQLQTAATPAQLLQSVVATIAATLKLPYVAIELADAQGRLGGASTGRAVAETVALPLHYQGETVGHLVVSPRSPGESFTGREQQLLADIVAQTGAMAHSVRLTAALQRSREHLVLAREEERRRIRRDLHDGLGPTLASQTFALDAVLELMEGDPAEAARLLRGLKAQNQETVAEIRRLVYALRPPSLDELGVVGALQAHVARFNGRPLPDIRIVAEPDPLPPLSAAVEVAAYRIALEAITNVWRHAEARRCHVSLTLAPDRRAHLRLDVCDDGRGIPSDVVSGVGLTSMRARAEELGGALTIDRLAPGTQVTAVLPLVET